MKLDMQGTAGGRGKTHMRTQIISVKYSSSERHRSSTALGHNNLCLVTMVTGQRERYQEHASPDVMNYFHLLLVLTYTYGYVCRPLVVILAGDGFFSDQLKAKLALKPQDSPV